MKVKNKRKKMWILIAIVALIAVYAVITVIPNLFVKKGIELSNYPGCILVGHRGGAGLAPENSLECIKRGIAAGAEMIEIDIHQTKDNQLIVCHDQSVNRTTNGKGLIRDMTLAELRKLRIKDVQGNITELRLPTLEEVLQCVDGQARLLIEIKRTGNIYQGIEARLLEMIHRYHASGWCIVQSFNDSVLENIHKQDTNIRLEKLVICKLAGLPLLFDGTFRKFDLKKYDYVSSFNFYYLAAPRYVIDNLHRAGKEVKIWTLQTPEATPDLPVNGVICDRPDLFAKTK